MPPTLFDNALFRNIYCNLSESTDPRCAAGGVFGNGLLPAGWEWLAFLLTGVAITALLINAALGSVLVFIWAERRLIGRFQARLGPNRWGPFGLLTPVADAIKTLFKEDIIPAAADRWVFNAAPVVMYIPALLVLAVIPWGTTTFLADLNIGILYIIAITSLSTFAVVMAGWGSQNRYAMFGAMRAVALLISYEIPMALSLLGVLMFAGSMSLVSIVAAQDIPFVLLQPLGFLVFLIAATAEINRAPFDLAEAESELGAGYHSDYSGMKFGMFLNAEFTAAMISAAILVALFFAGGRGPFLPSPVWFVLKMMIILFIMIWTRVTWPRLRIDQVLAFAWKGLLALAFINLVASALLIYVWPDPSIAEQWIIVGINWAIMIASVTVIGKLLAPTMTPAVTFATESSLPRPTMAGQSAGGGD